MSVDEFRCVTCDRMISVSDLVFPVYQIKDPDGPGGRMAGWAHVYHLKETDDS